MNIEDVQNYVKSRFLELLHKETLDTYRVRHNNVYTSLVETRDLIQRCSEMKVKTFETVRVLATETIELLKVDTCLRFRTYPRELLVREIEEFLKKNTDKFPTKLQDDRIQFCLRRCIEENKESYLSALLEELDRMLMDCSTWDNNAMSDIRNLDAIICALSVQLIYEGYSKQYLFLELKHRAYESFDSFYKSVKDMAKKEMRHFEVIWRLRIVDGASKLYSLGFKTEVNGEHIDERDKKKYARKIAPAQNIYFYQDEVFALDRFSAVRQSREKLMQVFDCLHLGVYSQKLALPNASLVLEDKANTWCANICVTGYFLDGRFSDDCALSAKLLSSLDKIYKSEIIDSSAQDRIRSAIRHLNCGDLDPEIGQRFINYWIALEFIFASPHTSENTFTRLKTYLIDVLAVSYVHRNVDYLNEKLLAEGIIAENCNLWDTIDTLDSVANKAGLPLIWKYKLKNMKSILFTHEDKLKQYYNNHIKNLERHIARIYNQRNVLVHEGAIKQDVENLASNLRYYLVFLLDQMIVFFASHANDKGRKYQMGDFFNEYCNYRRIIEADFKLATLLSVPINKELW